VRVIEDIFLPADQKTKDEWSAKPRPTQGEESAAGRGQGSEEYMYKKGGRTQADLEQGDGVERNERQRREPQGEVTEIGTESDDGEAAPTEATLDAATWARVAMAALNSAAGA